MSYYAVGMVSPLLDSFLIGHCDMRSVRANIRSTDLFVGILKAYVGRVCVDNRQKYGSAPRRKVNVDFVVEYAKCEALSLGSKAIGTTHEFIETGFVMLELSAQAFGLGQQVLVVVRPAKLFEAMNRLLNDLQKEAESVFRSPEAET